MHDADLRARRPGACNAATSEPGGTLPKDNVRKVAQGKDGNKGDVYDGTCPGAIKLLDAEHHYRPEHVPFA